MADNNEKDRITNMEDQIKQLLVGMQQMSTEIKALRTNPIAALPPPDLGIAKQKESQNFPESDDDDMPPLDDDSVQVAIGKSKPEEAKVDRDKRLEKLEEKFKLLQNSQGPIPTDLSVYSKIKVPTKFKMPEFEKYDGTTCPRAHLQIYLVRMTQYVTNAPLMIQTFQASLTGPALRWYITKNMNLVETWEEVSQAFLKQYKYIADIIPSRDDLERVEKKKAESFKEYAIRWRNLAAQIIPEPTDQDLKRMFLKALPHEYRHRMVIATVETFNQLIPVGEQIEIGLRDGWFTEPATVGRRFTARREKEPEAEINVAYTQPRQGNAIPAFQAGGSQPQKNNRQSFPKREKRQFTPLPGPLSQVLEVLRKRGLLTSEPKRPNSERFANYDPSKRCEYHMGEVGHSTDECFTLKLRVQDLLDTKAFSFKSVQSNVQDNPLPDHAGHVGAIFG